MSASASIKALRTRLEDAGREVVLFTSIDPKLDDLPLVGVYFGRDGEQRVTDEPTPTRSTLNLEIVRVAYGTGDDPEIEAVEAAEALSADLLTHVSDKRDNLDGACHWAEQTQMSIDTREDVTNAIVSRVQIQVHY